MLTNFIKRKKGLTLLEIMIVIGIVAMLMTVLIPQMQKARSQSKLAVCMENIKSLATCIEMYAMDNKHNPPDNTATLDLLVTTQYIKSVPLEPVSGKKYFYEGPSVTASAKNYTIMCAPISDQNHGDIGIPAGHPFYTPLKGQEKGLGI